MGDMKDGGPAFPCIIYDAFGQSKGNAQGMSLRDWFAGQALIEWSSMVTLKNDPEYDRAQKRIIADHCYDFADAMLAARVHAMAMVGLKAEGV